MDERWLPVPGYEGLYEVSDCGRVKSLPRRATCGVMLRPQVTAKGYLRVGLSKDGKVRFKAVHLLVLAAFVGPCPPGYQGLHGSGGPADNRWPENVYYGTPGQNQLDRVRDGTSNRGERSSTAKLTAEIVAQCRRRFAAGESQAALAAEFGVSDGAMCNAIRGKTWAGEICGVLPVTAGRPSQSTNAFREKMAAAGRAGAAARWHPETPQR